MIAFKIRLRITCSILAFSVLAALFYSHSGNAQINPMQIAVNAGLCFNNKLIYKGCNKEHQVDESGHLDIPCESTNEFCNGPCFSEIKSLLNCINNVASNFLFTNGATTKAIGNMLDNGCNGYINQRGIFIAGNDDNNNLPSGSCGLNLSGSPPENAFQFTTVNALLLGLALSGCFLLLFQPIIL